MRIAVRPSQAGAIGVDLGTSTSSVYAPGRGVVLEEPSVVAMDSSTRALVAAGEAAERLCADEPDRFARVRPLRGGVVVHVEAATVLLRQLLRASARRPRLVAPRVAVGVPADACAEERHAVVDAALRAGARGVALVDEPTAAAIGAGVAVAEVRPSIVVDIGGGTTEVAIVADGGVVAGASSRVGGDDIDAAVVGHLRLRHRMVVDLETAEALKRGIGSAHRSQDEGAATLVEGRSDDGGSPVTAWVGAAELRQAITPTVERIGAVVQRGLASAPPEQSADVVTGDLVLTGGGALLRGLDRHLCHLTGMPVRVASAPQRSVAVGAGRCLCHFELFAEAATA